MSEKEKKAIEDLIKEIIILKENSNKIIDSKELLNYKETLLKLITRQKQELEKEKEKNKEAGVILGKRIKICNEFQLELEKEKEKNKELKKENKKLNLVRLQYLVSSFPDTTETYKKYKKELDELIKEE